jgi:hypothetical protein
VSENRVLRRIFGPKRDKVTGEWRRIYNEEFNDRYFSTHTIWVIKSRRMRWVGHLSHIEDKRCAYRVLVGKPEERDHFEDLGRDGRIILKWIFKKRDWGHRLLIWLRERWQALVNTVINLWVL